MSVGYARQRGQEGRPVLFPQQGPHCITVVRQTQVCLESLGSYREKKKTYNTKPHRQSYIVSLFMCQHIDYRGLFCGFHFVTFFFSLFMFKCLEVLFWQATQKLLPSHE